LFIQGNVISSEYTINEYQDRNLKTIQQYFDVLLTMHLSIFIPVINQLYAQNFVLE